LTWSNNFLEVHIVYVVTITDGVEMPIRDADVEILIASNSPGHAESDGHGEPEADEHSESVSNGHAETNTHESEPEHDSMSGMPGAESTTRTPNEPAHEEATTSPIPMMEFEHGIYIAEAHLEAAGQHEIQVMFHAHGEMLQTNFVIEVPGPAS
jgi:hypothetical protein